MRSVLLSSVFGVSFCALPAMAQTVGYYQEPAFNDQMIVFSSEGDLWRAGVNGGLALRLTTHDEVETNPVLSPDGQRIAFEASYDGPTEIYTMSVAGGMPQRMTFEGGGVSLRGWSAENGILYTSSNGTGPIFSVMRTINPTSGAIDEIPLADTNLAALSGDGSTLFFTRYGLDMFNDNAIQYRGGRMSQLWSYAVGSDEEAVRLAASFDAPIRSPMWWDGRVYFVTDQSGTDNIWSMDETGGDIRQHTSSTEWQMREPYLNNGKIMYQSGADLYRYDIGADTTETISLSLLSDSDFQRDRWIEEPLNYLSNASMSPDGESVTVTARGRYVTAFPHDRRRVEYQVPVGYQARSAVPSGDGESIYVIMDGGTRGEIWSIPADGSGPGEALTEGSEVYIWEVIASPHDASLFYTDKRGRLFYLDPEEGGPVLVDTTESSNDQGFGDFNWSSDGRYVAYLMGDSRDIAQIAVYDTETGERDVMTTGRFDSHAPAFSQDNAWLYFVSNRNFDATPGSPWGDRNMGPSFSDRGLIYALQLDPEADFPFQRPDELSASDEDESDADEDEDESEEDEEEVASINFDGASERLWQVPVPAGDFSSLATTDSHLFVMKGGSGGNSLSRLEFSDDDPNLDAYATGIMGFQLSADGKTVLIGKRSGGSASFYLTPSSRDFPSDASDYEVRLSDWRLRINPDEEWDQMAQDAWRLHRDFSFDPNLRGVDWDAVGEHFLPFAPRIGHRTELNDLMAQMSAELGILHSQIRQGDNPSDDESGAPAFLGAKLEPVEGGLEIADIYDGEPDLLDTLGPLSQPGMDFAVGDVITQIDNSPVSSLADLSFALDHRVGQQVLVTYERGRETLQDIVTPVSRRDDAMLRYRDWVQANRTSVAEASDNEIGYLHLRAMGSGDVESFVRDFYEHFDKDGIIIDVRGNRGGNIDSWLIATLLRQSWAFWQSPHGGPAYTNMQQAFRGHLVILIDEGTYSDGETFAAGVKALDIAPLIGTRTAGAGIWLSDRNRLVDGGQARVAEYAQYGIDGRWLLEGNGVSPDIEIDTPPHAAYLGEDLQLDEAISVLQTEIANNPIPELVPGPITPLGTPGQDVD
ncbi:S41 family peptidase [Ponticaulis sp.]|uniref:S41 family peptidase n=1 Tax=Ponticaulis sp. TaxID=2020902 RepID=UPI000B6B7A00|nr:S41 family peptidase [Ponticaulis sp.]MAJ09978.1 peptidase S41 [Ponticaulis sp.]